jgi:diguanylate cyclase (GGDEF)-like protein
MTPQGNGSADWLRLPAAAAVAGVGPTALRRRADAGELPCYRRPGGPRFFRRRDAEALRDTARPRDPAPPSALATGADARALRDGLYTLARRLSQTADLHETVELLASGLRELADAVDCDIWMPEAERLRCVTSCDVHGFDRAVVGRTLPVERYPLTRRILDSGRPLAIDDLHAAHLDPVERDAMLGWGFVSFLSIPMISAGKLVGLIDLYDIVPRDFARLSETLEPSSDILAGAFAKAALLDRLEQSNRELRRQNRRLSSLLDAGRAITSTLVVEDVLRTLARKSAEAVGAPECLIYEFDLDEGVMVVRSDYVAEGLGVAAFADPTIRYRMADYPKDTEILLGGVPVQELLSDPDIDPVSRRSMRAWGEKSVLNVPFAFGDQPLGLLVIVETETERRFTAEEVELVRGIGEQAAAALHNAKVYRELEQRQRETELLNEIARKITSTLRVEDIADATLVELRRLVPFDRASVVLVDEHGRLATILSSDSGWRYAGMDAGAVAAELAERLRTGQALMLDLPTDGPLPADDPVVEGLRSGAVAGLLVDGELIGALSLGSEQPRAFSTHHLHVLARVATHLSLALGNARLYENIRRLHLSNLKALSSALSAKDYYTLGHAARVAAYMVLLGKELGWPHETLVQAEEAAYLHDIGKIAISDRVLLKPSRLNTREWELMRQHPSFSADIIGTLFAPELVAAVRHHHERWDGAGYPDGLAGDDIPPLAQAMCIVDCYDAMSSWRPYRSAMTYSDCLLELERCRGQQFDPRLVDAFRRVLSDLTVLHARAGEIARDAARLLDVEQHGRVVASGDMDSPDYAAVAATLRQVRDDHPPARFLTTIVAGESGLTIVVDGEEEPSQHSPCGEPVLVDDELQAEFAGRKLDINVVLVDAWGAWVSGIAPLRDESGAIVAVVNADLPADVGTRLEGLRGNLSETFTSLVHSAAVRFSRAEVDAITDGLTGIFNHRYLHERLAEEVESTAERQGELTLLFCDLDHFKQFNDRFGHSAGDAALSGVAQIIESSIRHVDLAARYGGEEFAVILVDTDAAAGMRVAERIRRRVAHGRHGGAGRLTISIGAATYPGDADSAERVIDRADAAMYEAKRLGRDRVVACRGAQAPEAPLERSGGGAVAAAPATGLGEARRRLAIARADLLAFVAGEVAARLGLSGQAVVEVAGQARERALAERPARGSAPAAPRQVAGELGDRIVAAVIAAGDVLAEHAGDGRPDREKLAARLRRAARETVEPDVLEALADVALARLVPAPPNGRP